MKVKIDDLGRIVIPKAYREALGISKQDELNIALTNKTIVINTVVKKCCLCGSKDVTDDIPLCSICIDKIKTENY